MTIHRNARILSLCLTAMLLMVHADSLFSQTPDADTKFRLAQGLEQAGEIERAAALYHDLAARDPANYAYFDGLQRTLLQLKRYDEAIEVIRARVSKTPADIGLHTLLGSVLYRAGHEKEADAEWDKALALDPANPNVYRIVAGVMIENRLLDKAAATYRKGRSSCGDPTLFTLELAQILVASMDYKGATQEYLLWLNQNPTQSSFVQNRLAAFSYKPDGRNAAIDVVRSAVDRNGDARLYEILGWLYLEGRDFNAAYDIYKIIDRLSGSNGSGLYAFAERAMHERAYDLAARAYRAAIDAPLPAVRQPAALYGYATALKEMAALPDTSAEASPDISLPATEARPQYANAIASYHDIARQYPRSEFAARALYQIGLIQFEKDFDLDGALASFRQAMEENPNVRTLRYDIALKTGQVMLARGDTTHAADQFQTVAVAADATPDENDEAHFRLAQVDYFRDRFPSAIQRLDSLTLNLKADYANDALALQSFLQENVATASQALIDYSRADFLACQKKNSEAVAIFQNIVKKYPQALLVDDALMRMASLQAASGLYRDALASYETLLTQFKESSISLDRARFQEGEVYEFGLKDPAQAIACYEKLLVEHPGSVLVEQARTRIRRLRGDVQ